MITFSSLINPDVFINLNANFTEEGQCDEIELKFFTGQVMSRGSQHTGF